jgi:hypothetical protein
VQISLTIVECADQNALHPATLSTTERREKVISHTSSAKLDVPGRSDNLNSLAWTRRTFKLLSHTDLV